MDAIRPYETTWEDWVLAGGPRAAFARPELPLHVEIGPGEDDFLLEQARDRPDLNWLGIEYSRKRVERYARRCAKAGVGAENLRFVWRPAADLVRPFLSPGVVAAYHVHFPDPWPKKHHARFRLFTPEFAAALAESLVPGGSVRLFTDVPAYADEIHAAFSAVPAFRSLYPPPGWLRVPPSDRPTVFEARWRDEGRDVHALRYDR